LNPNVLAAELLPASSLRVLMRAGLRISSDLCFKVVIELCRQHANPELRQSYEHR